jgi:hypothetical protein
MDASPMSAVDYEETQAYTIVRNFLTNRDAYLKELLD